MRYAIIGRHHGRMTEAERHMTAAGHELAGRAALDVRGADVLLLEAGDALYPVAILALGVALGAQIPVVAFHFGALGDVPLLLLQLSTEIELVNGTGPALVEAAELSQLAGLVESTLAEPGDVVVF